MLSAFLAGLMVMRRRLEHHRTITCTARILVADQARLRPVTERIAMLTGVRVGKQEVTAGAGKDERHDIG